VALDQDGSAAVEGRHHQEVLHGSEGHAMEVASLLGDNHADISGVAR